MSEPWGPPPVGDLTAFQLMLESGRLLREYGFNEVAVTDPEFHADGEIDLRVYEDEVSFVGLAGFSDWPQLSSSWMRSQERLGRLIGRRVNSGDAKVWDTYLVLFVGQQLTPNDHAEAVEIRYNTRRARKIVVTGDDVRGPQDLELALMPVRPVILTGDRVFATDPLEDLVGHLERQGDQGHARVLVQAYRESRLLLESLHEWRTQS